MNNQQNLTQSQAVNVLIQAARIAQSKGAFTLEDAELISHAIKLFIPPSTDGQDSDPVLNNQSNDTLTSKNSDDPEDTLS